MLRQVKIAPVETGMTQGIDVMRTASVIRLILASATALTSSVVLIAPASAQTTVASIRGRVTDANGAVVPGATVTLSSAGTGRSQTATTSANGTYILNGVRAGTYRITVTGPNEGRFEQEISVGVGQSATVDARLAAAPASGEAGAPPPSDDGAGSQIVVTGSRLRETRTSEIATNISQEQIRVLPQTDRNFLSFAALAPGVRYNDSETDKSFSSGASPASQVNVFVDGVSLKNKLREGGIAG